jgi:hypothetical protein
VSPPLSPLAVREQRVDHHIADEVDPLPGDPFRLQVLIGGPLGGEEKIRELIGEDAVDLFRHGAVVTAETGLHVRDGDAPLRRHQGAGEGGVHIADDQHPIGGFLRQRRIEGEHDPSCLLGVVSRADAQIGVRFGQRQLAKEEGGHPLVVVLARVHEPAADPGTARCRVQDGRHLHEVRPRPNDAGKMHGYSFETSWSPTPVNSTMCPASPGGVRRWRGPG